MLVAPPGAGKTTRVPLVLAREDWAQKARRILVLEPRRLAARAAAERMAQTLGERVGDTVGLRVRFGSKISRRTRIEIITEGIFTRLILDDPMLDGVAAVLFDEFHERSLDADLGLALARDVQQGLREDLRILVMSATIDGARIATLLGDAPVIDSEGRAFAVETRYAGRDARPIEPQIADTIVRAMRADAGSLLAFLPGAAEIRRTKALLEGRTEPSTDVVALYGALTGDEQDRAIAPAPPGRRKIVLATSIAETSITIEGVRIVVDCGLARVPRYEPDVGVTRLETVRVSRAAADQRRGRAGRTEPGVCYRLWDEPQTAALEPFARPEILAADLSSFALDLAAWGGGPDQLAFLDPPPRAALTEAKALLAELGAIDGDGRITAEGRLLAAPAAAAAARAHGGRCRRAKATPCPPRKLPPSSANAASAATMSICASASMRCAATARRARATRAPWRSAGRRSHLLPPHKGEARNRASARCSRSPIPSASPRIAAAERARSCSSTAAAPTSIPPRRWRASRSSPSPSLPARRRRAASSPPRRSRLPRSSSAFPIASKRARKSRSMPRARACAGEGAGGSAPLRFPTSRCRSSPMTAPRKSSPTASPVSASHGCRGPKRSSNGATASCSCAQAKASEWPDLSDAALAQTASAWLAPALAAKTALGEITADELNTAVRALLPWPLQRRLDAEAPTHFEAPTGSQVPIDYEAEGGPKIAIRVQELFGLDRHPAIAGGKVPLLIELLSPAHRPVQMTRDLPGFWRGSYAAVRAEMRGRYPKHPWPDDPIAAPATRRAKPRNR